MTSPILKHEFRIQNSGSDGDFNESGDEHPSPQLQKQARRGPCRSMDFCSHYNRPSARLPGRLLLFETALASKFF